MARLEKPSTTTPVRLPDELRAWLKHEAIDARRTLGNEIVYRLEQSRTQQLSNQPQKGNQQ